MNILTWDKFFESNLSQNDLTKGERGEVLIRKLSNREPIKTNNGDVVITKMLSNDKWVDPIEGVENLKSNNSFDLEKSLDYLKNGRMYKSVFKDENGKSWRLTQFVKTEEFGSSGPGRRTKQFETVQTIFLAIKQNNPSIRINQNNFKNLFITFIENNDFDHIKIPESIKIDKNIIQDFINDNNWIDTFCEIPNKLWNENLVDRNKRYVIYQDGYNGESAIKSIMNKYKEISKVEDFQEISFSKWCPADVFFIETQYEKRIDILLNKMSSMDDLNKLMDRLFDAKLLIPLSLKKIKSNKYSRNFRIIVNRERGKELPNFKLKDILVSPLLKGIGSKISAKSLWKFKDNKKLYPEVDRFMTFDSPNSGNKADIDGEVEGSTSRHGKISLKAIRYFLSTSDMELPIIPSSKELQKLTMDELREKEIDLINRIGQEPEIKGRDNNTEGKLISKIQSLIVVLSIKKIYDNDRTLANDIITKMFRYALSIQTHKFETPRYLRVI